MNKYLEKIAEVDYGVRYNHMDMDVSNEDEESRREAIDEANEVLVRHGFKPTFDYNHAPSLVSANSLVDRDFKASLRPNEVNTNKKSLLGALFSGGAVGVGVGLQTGDPLLGVLSGVASGVLGGHITKRISYTNAKREADDLTFKSNQDLLRGFLRSRYEKE